MTSARRWRWLIGALALWIGVSACADEPAIVFQNHRDYPVSVHIDGDRVLILRPFTAEGLPYQVAAWSWPRTIEIRPYGSTEVISRMHASAGDLATWHWRVDIR